MKKKFSIIFISVVFYLFFCNGKSFGQHYQDICDYVKNEFKSRNCKIDYVGKLSGYVVEGEKGDGFLKYFLDNRQYMVDYKENYKLSSNGIMTINNHKFDIVKDIGNRNIADLSGINDKAFSLDGLYLLFYEVSFKKSKYLVALSHISGYTENNPLTINFCIFDVGNPEKINYFFMQSYLGCIDNIGDFNKDGNLDVLISEITGFVKPTDNIHSDPKYYELRMYSLVDNEFVIDQNHYSKLKDDLDNKGILVIEDNWDF